MAPRAIFIGPMGSGKSTIGKAVAHALDLPFRDTDSIIEELEQLPVSQIFIDKGEDYFRAIEKKVLRDELLSDGSILALGGGAPYLSMPNPLSKFHQHQLSTLISL